MYIHCKIGVTIINIHKHIYVNILYFSIYIYGQFSIIFFFIFFLIKTYNNCKIAEKIGEKVMFHIQCISLTCGLTACQPNRTKCKGKAFKIMTSTRIN